MHGEAPEFKRCCFCLPLRRGLITWGYGKLVVNLLSIAYAILTIRLCFVWDRNAGDIAICTVVMTLLLIDLSFNIVFIVASHKKSVMLLKVSYIYNMVWLGFVLLISGFQLYINLHYVYMWGYRYVYAIYNLVFSAGVAFLLIFTQIYLILLIRSEMEKLRKQSLEMQFTNHLASGEPQCKLHNASDQSEGKKQVVQVGCTDEKQVVQDCCTDEKQVVQDRQEASLLHERGV